MNFVLGILFFAVLTGFCGACLRRFAEEKDPALLALGAMGTSLIALILGGALLLPWFSPVAAMTILFLLSLGGLIGLYRLKSWPSLVPRKDTLWLSAAGTPGAIFVAVFGLFILSWSFAVDDGFFLHSSNIGMILAGKYPPTSFLGEPLQGHYGKDMLTALLALVFGVNFLEMEWFSSVFVQVLHFYFLLHWLRVEGGKPVHGLLGAHFAFLASAFGPHFGLADTLSNNNAVAYFTVSICSYLLLRWYRLGTAGAAVMTGIFLGVDALIYEIHFGLLGLALFTITLFKRERFKSFFLLVTVAVVLAAVEGGPITHLAQKAVFGRAQHQQNVKKAMQSQNVEIKIPKDNLFHLRRDNLIASRFFETKLRPASVSFEPSRELAPVWSPEILSVFWYPVWLAPLVLVALFRQRNLLAGWFFAFGFYSILTPCIVGFGYYEGETTRWLFGTAVGLSVAYSLVLAESLYQARGKWQYGAIGIFVWSIWFNFPVLPLEFKEMTYALNNPGKPQLNSNPGILEGGGLIPRPRLSLAHHHGFDGDSFIITNALKERAQGDFLSRRYLVNYKDENVPRGTEAATGGVLNVMGFQTGLSGRLPAGLAGAPENEWCAPLFAQNLQAKLFWYDPQLWRLHELGARWLLVDRARLSDEQSKKLEAIPEIELVAESGDQSLWEIPDWSSTEKPAIELSSVTFSTPEEITLEARSGFWVDLSFMAEDAGEAQILFRYLTVPSDELANPEAPLAVRLGFVGGPQRYTVALVAPYYPGRYTLQWCVAGRDDWQNVGEVTVIDTPVTFP